MSDLGDPLDKADNGDVMPVDDYEGPIVRSNTISVKCNGNDGEQNKRPMSFSDNFHMHPHQHTIGVSQGVARRLAQSHKKQNDVARMALSQPSLYAASKGAAGTQGENPETPMHTTIRGGLMSREDIFYTGSLVNIAHHRMSSSGKLGGHGRHKSETKLPIEDIRDDKSMCCGLVTSPSAKEALRSMLDMELLKDPIFILFAFSNFCTSIGFNVPYVYIVASAEELGISKERASLLLSVLGVANTVGRVALGWVADKPWVNRLWIYNVSLTICGI
ncbi:hypothetical protein J437_LFUL009282, partial [Ladona fulva]